MTSTLACSFCRKSEHQVRKLVAGPGVYICDGCVAIAHRIMADADSPPAGRSRLQRLAARARALCDSARRRVRLTRHSRTERRRVAPALR